MSKAILRLDWASHKAAKYACQNWHYSQCMPAGKLIKVGVWENEVFIGVVLYGRGTSNHLVTRYGLNNTEGCELVRVALKSHVNNVSRIMAISIKFLKTFCPNMRLIVSFAAMDQGHHGGIYQAGNWLYTGLTSKQDEFSYKGRRSTDRQISQMVKDTRTPRAELERRGIIRRLPTQQKHRYLYALDAKMREQIQPLAKLYPKRVKRATNSDQLKGRQFDTDPHAPIIPQISGACKAVRLA